VQLYKNGDVFVDQKKLPGDEAILGLAREARSKNEDLRAVIQAEQAVTHGRVIGVLELLKTAGISKIAFGVTPVDKVDESRKDGEGK
jgi:biopolymer transport protein ExbD